jgi:tRNA splicing endonuclease
MKNLVAGALLVCSHALHAGAVSPIGKVVQMLSDLQAKVIKEGEAAQKVYEEYSEWCEDRASDLSHEIKTGKGEVETLEATIAQEKATTEEMTAKIDDLTGSLTMDESDLKAATEIRAMEAGDFAKEESELTETLSMLQRATFILEREMAKGGASMVQLKDAQNIAQALTVMVQASSMTSADASRLSALLQTSHLEADEDEDVGAPDASVYKGHSGDIVDVLKKLSDDAESMLDAARKKETANLHNFEMLKQSLQDEIRFANKDMDAAKAGRSSSGERKATAEGDLAATSKALQADVTSKAELHQDCMAKAEDFEAEVKSRGAELKALADAKKVINEATGAAADISYSFLQTSRTNLASRADLANFEVERFVRDLARKESSTALAQLAQRIAAAVRMGSQAGADPFAKIKGLIGDMISKLEAEAGADASKKAYCDKELSETNTKKSDKTAEISKLTTRIDRMKARSSILKEEMQTLQAELANLASTQTNMDALRSKEHEAFTASKADMEKGITGVKMALKILSEYYSSADKAHEASGAGSGIISLLEVVESDFSKDLAEIVSTEETAAAAYNRETKDNEIEKTTKDKDLEYKTKESTYLDKESAELTTDREGVQAELDAVMEYLAKIEEECIAKAETYASIKQRREAEIAGLKEALTILESETALMQRRVFRHRSSLRGS